MNFKNLHLSGRLTPASFRLWVDSFKLSFRVVLACFYIFCFILFCL